jgi:hypothetical protein
MDSSSSACSCSFERVITESTSHYAVFPPALLDKPIEACCPRRVCRTCGTPSRRLTAKTPEYAAARAALVAGDPASFTAGDEGRRAQAGPGGKSLGRGGGAASLISNGVVDATPVTTGWTSCDCPGTDGIRLDGYHTGTGWRPGHVLDPFGGSGTTGVVASGRSRDCTLIDLDSRNADLARERLGMFLEVETHQPEAVA